MGRIAQDLRESLDSLDSRIAGIASEEMIEYLVRPMVMQETSSTKCTSYSTGNTSASDAGG